MGQAKLFLSLLLFVSSIELSSAWCSAHSSCSECHSYGCVWCSQNFEEDGGCHVWGSFYSCVGSPFDSCPASTPSPTPSSSPSFSSLASPSPSPSISDSISTSPSISNSISNSVSSSLSASLSASPSPSIGHLQHSDDANAECATFYYTECSFFGSQCLPEFYPTWSLALGSTVDSDGLNRQPSCVSWNWAFYTGQHWLCCFDGYGNIPRERGFVPEPIHVQHTTTTSSTSHVVFPVIGGAVLLAVALLAVLVVKRRTARNVPLATLDHTASPVV